MKLIFAILFLFCVSIQGEDITTKIADYAKVAIAKWISQGFISRLENEIKTKGQLLSNLDLGGSQSKASIIPKIDDPLNLESFELPLYASSEVFKSKGKFSLCTSKVTGLSKLKDSLEIGLEGGISLKWSLNIPTTIKIEGPYKLDAIFNAKAIFETAEDQHFSGENNFFGSVDDVFMKLDATVKTKEGKLSLKNLSIDLGFKKLKTKIHETSINGKLTNLDHFGSLIQLAYRMNWKKETKQVINKQVKCAVNKVIQKCSLADIIGSNFDCLNFELNESCFGEAGNLFKFDGNQEDLKTETKYCDTKTKERTEPETKIHSLPDKVEL